MQDRLRSNGVVGAGGAGFPTYAKLGRAVDTVILNAAECEPLLHKDAELLEHYAAEVLEGVTRVMGAVGAARGLIAIKVKHGELIAALERRVAGTALEVCTLADTYPAGDEFITVYEATGRIIPPGGLPGDVGCLVVNVETMLNVTLDRPVTHKYLTIGGAVPEPMTVRAPVGASFGDVLRAAGVEPEGVDHVLVGGVMMGRLMRGLDESVTRTTGALLCFPEGHGLMRRYLPNDRVRARIGKSACDQCSICTELCPRYLLGHPIEPHIAMRSLGFNQLGDSVALGSQFCCECNLCSLYACPEDLFPMNACRDDKARMREKGVAHPAQGSTAVKAHSMREYRRIPTQALFTKLGLKQFRDVAPLTEVHWDLDQVRIPLRQHIGAPAVPAVRAGQAVEEGQPIGSAPEGLGVAVHASMAGTVASVDETEVVIRRNHG